MKRILKLFLSSMVFLGLLSHAVYSQTLDEWLKPKKTQIEYLIKQVALFQSMGKAVKDSEGILGAGLDLIGDSKVQEYNSHGLFFDAHRIPGELTQEALLNMERLDLHPAQVEALILQSRGYWSAKSKWDYPSLFGWSDSIHSGMLDRVAEQLNYLTLLVGQQGLEMEDTARAKLVLSVLEQMGQLKKDLLSLQEKSHAYLNFYSLNLTETL